MTPKLKEHIKDLHQIDNQRKGWLFLSAFVSAAVLGIIFGWNWVNEYHLVWVFVSAGLVLAVVWWYWTMRLIRHLIQYKTTESEILQDIVADIRYIKNKVIEPLDK
jgi:ABC-type bacteriocin/lantibiotic exporter with double-glycine peptidase domain